MNFVEARLDKAERLLAKNDYRRALGELDLAVCNLSHTDSSDDYDRLEQLLDQAAASPSRRRAEKALELQKAARTEINRLRSKESRASPTTGAQAPSPSFGVGALVMVGTFAGLLVGAMLGSLTASNGGDIQELNDLAGLLVAVTCMIVGAVIGLGVGLARRESRIRFPEAPEDDSEPPYWPPPPDWTARSEHGAEADAQR